MYKNFEGRFAILINNESSHLFWKLIKHISILKMESSQNFQMKILRTL